MISLKVTGIEKALEKLDFFESDLEPRMQEVVNRLMADGYLVASAGFKNAAYPGFNDVEVLTPVWEGDLLVLRAEGNAVAFIEFGTGKKYEKYPTDIPGESVDPYSALGMSQRGEYGHKRGSSPKGWVYAGSIGNGGLAFPMESRGMQVNWTMGNPPARAMYQAAVTVADRQRAIEIAREVFSK